jgi:predicted AAA+ superfamily ATPase
MINDMIPRPDYIDKIMTYVDTPFVKILTGVRRCGKSTILKMIVGKLRERGIPDDRILIYNFDPVIREEFNTAKLLYDDVKNKLANNGKTYLLFDEIQEVENWENAVNSFITDFNVDIYVTGSNSRMMSSEISTYLTGRYVSFRVFPLSFAEYLMFREWYSHNSNDYSGKHGEDSRLSGGSGYGGGLGDGGGFSDGSGYGGGSGSGSGFADGSGYGGGNYTASEFARYLRYGGFPAIHLRHYSLDEAYTIVSDVYNSTIYTDIVNRGQIRNVDQFERIVRFVFDNIGRTFSAAAISKYFKNEKRNIDNETVMGYLRKLESAFILHRCSRYDLQGKEILKTQEKFFVSDPAMRYSVIGYTPDSIAAMLENIVYLELLRRGYDVHIGQLPGGEIDFVAAKQENKIYIQITQQITSDKTENREYGRLLAIRDNYPKYVLRIDEFAGGNQNGIKSMNIADFLLSKEY